MFNEDGKGTGTSILWEKIENLFVTPRIWRDLVGVINVFIMPGEVSSKNNKTKLF